MKYYEVDFRVTPLSEDACDVLSAILAEVGFETFMPSETGVLGYVQQSLWDEAAVSAVLADFPFPGVTVSMTVTEAPDEDWNAQWEAEGFEPVVVDDLLCVHDTNHTDIPACRYDIVINPRLAFGTGTHPTTRMLLHYLADRELEGLRVIDAGCGTGVLGIMAAKRGAAEVLGYDIDEWSVDNSIVNYELNGIAGARALLGDSQVLVEERNWDLLIANINRNILLGDMSRFAAALKPEGSTLLLSGFYEEDIPYLVDAAAQYGLQLAEKRITDGWAMLALVRLAAAPSPALPQRGRE